MPESRPLWTGARNIGHWQDRLDAGGRAVVFRFEECNERITMSMDALVFDPYEAVFRNFSLLQLRASLGLSPFGQSLSLPG